MLIGRTGVGVPEFCKTQEKSRSVVSRHSALGTSIVCLCRPQDLLDGDLQCKKVKWQRRTIVVDKSCCVEMLFRAAGNTASLLRGGEIIVVIRPQGILYGYKSSESSNHVAQLVRKSTVIGSIKTVS
jgi:hypothetical protein